MNGSDPLSLVVLVAMLSVVPLLMVVGTAFLKISTVMLLVRNALGVQQVPPNVALYGLSLILTLYVMAPVVQDTADRLRSEKAPLANIGAMIRAADVGSEPMRQFLVKFSKPDQRAFFLQATQKMWPPGQAARVRDTDFLILLPAFVVGELTSAFEIGFLLYLPFVVIDLIVSNVLLALGMMMVSPSTISLPLKLFLFVMVDGWTRLLHGLVLSYA
ncbi:type III secretion system export apparatus subunit SctR [Rhodoferax sp. TBRC 17660]|jgi:type III secretion protein R|uniref:Type III secretion system export apparatus subunit SctR n=1 Tax=Rhodoferax potami TaxID=3068338 RepID=A0ABU3KU67_9BURK|nr:type III secretion system export apparatus subunit SctR [Rhodoferax sp. TBRC 17660]MDT7520742.1 type III secretion system export apparatus subunit SctR [Rhodoferax sp. TBRC 17660]